MTIAPESTEFAPQQTAEYATILAEAIVALTARLDEIRLPLHVLTENHFGELNDNQEEMIRAARAAADEAVAELHRLREIADVDRGALRLKIEPVRVTDLVRSLVPRLQAQAAKEGIRLDVQIEPDVPRVDADRVRLRDALSLAMTDAVRYAVPGSTVTLRVSYEEHRVVIEATHGSRHEHTGNLLLAQRLVAAQGGTVADQDGRTRIVLKSKQTVL